jgi:site-specific DNA recombinase
VHEIEQAGAHIASATESIDTSTAMGRAFFGLTAVFAQLESDQISERIKATHKHLERKHGRSTMCRQPYGWTYDLEAKVIRRNPTQQLTLAKIHAMHANHASDSIIARELNAIGTPAPKGGVWYSSTVERVRRQAKEAEKAERKAQRAAVNTSS